MAENEIPVSTLSIVAGEVSIRVSCALDTVMNIFMPLGSTILVAFHRFT